VNPSLVGKNNQVKVDFATMIKLKGPVTEICSVNGIMGADVVKMVKCYTACQKVAGSSPSEVFEFF
jgi:hypothetical protein